MFKKKPQIKNLSPLRSSDRRKLADQIIADYHVTVPPLPPAESTDTSAPSQSVEQRDSNTPTLTSIRTSLIPETCLSARFTTHAGASATLVSGTVYVGAHPGQEERILWLQYGKDARLYPTVYSCWQNPGLVPLLHSQDFVVEKLQAGADLMTPGLMGGPPWPEGAKQGAVVAVAGLGSESVPMWVGVCKIDVSALGRVQGMKGAAVEGLHWCGDEIWNWSQTGNGGGRAPERIEGWFEQNRSLEESVNQLELDDEDEEEAQEDGGVSLDASTAGLQNGHTDAPNGKPSDEEQDANETPDREPSTAEVDEAFHEAFLYSVYKAKKDSSPPHYGLDFPIQPSFLISNLVQPHLRFQTQHYSIKKTTWKNVKKFIKHLDKQALVKSKDRNGGETVILDIDFNNQQITSFTPYRLPKPKPHAISDADQPGSSSTNADPSLTQSLTLLTLYRASPKLVPSLLPSKSNYYTSHEITSFLKTYITNNPSLTDPTTLTSKRYLNLDPFLSNTILSSTNPADAQPLAMGEIARDVLQKRLLDDSTLCIPHWLLLRNPEPTSAFSTPDFSASDFLSTHPTLKPKPNPHPVSS